MILRHDPERMNALAKELAKEVAAAAFEEVSYELNVNDKDDMDAAHKDAPVHVEEMLSGALYNVEAMANQLIKDELQKRSKA